MYFLNFNILRLMQIFNNLAYILRTLFRETLRLLYLLQYLFDM